MATPTNGTTTTILQQSRIWIPLDLMPTPNNIQPGLPPHSLVVLLMCLLEELERLCMELTEAEVRIVGGSVLIIHEGNWVCAETAVWTLEGISVLNDKPTAFDEFGFGQKEEVLLYEEDEEEDKITVKLDKHVPLNGIVTTSPVVECFEENDEDEAEDDSALFALSLINFAHTRLAPGQRLDTGILLAIATLI